jgi:hypothetical protein
VQTAIRYAFSGLKDVNDAIVALSKKTGTGSSTATSSATSVVGGGGSGSSASSIGLVNQQTTGTYTLGSGDFGAIIVLDTTATFAVTLASFTTPFYAIISNQCSGLATLTPQTGTVNGVSSWTIPPEGFAVVAFDGLNWWAASVYQNVIFTRGGTILNPSLPVNVVIWYAPFACTVTNVLGYVDGATGSVINARRNGTLPLLVSNLTLGTADAWTDGGAVQNTAISVGDKLEIMVISVSGTPTQIAVEIQCTRP